MPRRRCSLAPRSLWSSNSDQLDFTQVRRSEVNGTFGPGQSAMPPARFVPLTSTGIPGETGVLSVASLTTPLITGTCAAAGLEQAISIATTTAASLIEIPSRFYALSAHTSNVYRPIRPDNPIAAGRRPPTPPAHLRNDC